jgi:glycosidase
MKKIFVVSVAALLLLTSFKPDGSGETGLPLQHEPWTRNATIYEVNIRQYTPEGTFNAFSQHLPRLQKMGVSILWLMPVNPIGEKNRKGSLGSYYSIRDYMAVNPEFGTMDDFRKLVKKAHKLGMKVIIDWVANHSSWDNPLITAHPEWYKKDSAGRIIPPVADWTDVAALDYSNAALRQYMNEALAYWIREADIDGYRCDVAGMVPVDYWNHAVPGIRKLKPLFMLAEEEKPAMHDTAFDATYSWELFHVLNDIAGGKKPASQIDSVLSKERRNYPADAYRMRFTSNHDENSWNGTEFERMGEGAKAFAVLAFTFPGMPLIYSGQESAMQRRLKFFDKDTIPWGTYPLEAFYTRLTTLKTRNTLLDAGNTGGDFIKVATANDSAVYAFIRRSPDNQLLVILNLSKVDQSADLKGTDFRGKYQDVFSGDKYNLSSKGQIRLKAWEYLVLEKK